VSRRPDPEWDEYTGGPGPMPKYPPVLTPHEAATRRKERERAERPSLCSRVEEVVYGVLVIIGVVLFLAVVLTFFGWPIPFMPDFGPSCSPQGEVNPCG
jgi:hypothetical protein